MRITMLGHACLLCETEDGRILMDPWLAGPSNFQSWWHLPEVTVQPSDLPPADYVYISHLHDDHFHPPTLSRLDRGSVVLIPKLYHDRLRRRIERLGFARIRELKHAREEILGRSTRINCCQIGNDSLLAVSDPAASMLNANDAFQGNDPRVASSLLDALSQRRRFDIVFLAFGTAGAFPKCYRFEDPAESLDPWVKERAMLTNFVRNAVSSKAKAVVPFAGGFALLSRRLAWMNEAKTTPADALEALRKKAPLVPAFEMNPSDIWDSRQGLIPLHPPIDWNERLAMIERMRLSHAEELNRIDLDERRGPRGLYDLFRSRVSENLRSMALLRKRMDYSVLFDVEGEPGGKWNVDLRQPGRWFREGDRGDWMTRVTIPARLLADVLTDPDGWETLGISYKLDVYMKKGARAREALLTRMMNTPSPVSLLKLALTPRFAEFVFNRKKEFAKLAREKLFAAGGPA